VINQQSLTPKRLFKDLFRGKQPGYIPFLPFNFSLACRLEQVPHEAFQTDPGIMVNALINSQKIFGFDVILTKVDLCLPGLVKNTEISAEAITEDIKTTVCLEATRRIKQTMDKQVVLACKITGPLSLIRNAGKPGEGDPGRAGTYTAEIARDAVLQIIKTVGEIGPDLILVEEEEVNQGSRYGFAETAALLEPLWNSIRYYNAEPLLVTSGISKSALELLSNDISGIVYTGEISANLDELAFLIQDKGVCVSLPLPAATFAGQFELLYEFVAQVKRHLGNRGVFACSPGEITPSISVEDMKNILHLLKELS